MSGGRGACVPDGGSATVIPRTLVEVVGRRLLQLTNGVDTHLPVTTARGSRRMYLGWGCGGALEPLFQPPAPLGGGSKGRLSSWHVFHAYSMTKPLALTQSVPVPVPVTVTVSAQRGGGGAIIIQTATVLVFERICYGQSR